MADPADRGPFFVRVATPGMPAFQLRKGEEGISVFEPNGVDPPLTEAEILESFRDGSYVIGRSFSRIEALDLLVESIEGGESLPQRLRAAHREIRRKPGMTRNAFKAALKELEEDD